MSIKKASLLINFFAVIAIVLAAILFFFLTQKIEEVNDATQIRFYNTLLVDELRRSSEELTRQVRIYAATGAESMEPINSIQLTQGGSWIKVQKYFFKAHAACSHRCRCVLIQANAVSVTAALEYQILKFAIGRMFVAYREKA